MTTSKKQVSEIIRAIHTAQLSGHNIAAFDTHLKGEISVFFKAREHAHACHAFCDYINTTMPNNMRFYGCNNLILCIKTK